LDKSEKITITFKGNDLVIVGKLPKIIEDAFTNKKSELITYFYPRDFFGILSMLKADNLVVNIDFTYDFNHTINFDKKFELYEFQQQAIQAWEQNNNKGIILLPTGAGKTMIAIEIIYKLHITTLIVVPTLILLEQWKNNLVTLLGVSENDIGEFGGGKQEIKAITVITYDSAHLYVKRLRTKFGLLVLDESHHLVGTSYEIIADGYLASNRLALTATLSNEETAFSNLILKGFSKIVFSLTPGQLQQSEIIVSYKIETIKVKINEIAEYERLIAILQDYLKRIKYNPNISTFQQLIFRVNRDQNAHQALDAYRQARNLSFSADSKLVELERLLRLHRDDKMIIFSDIVSFCERISKVFFIPCITHRTKKEERTWIVNYFKRVNGAKLVVSKILDEGVDIPSAKIGVIIAGSGKNRQFIQRLGRIIRHYQDKNSAILYEIISESTLEEKISIKRKKDID
jgi:superfamily II DNA or RNA helicase